MSERYSILDLSKMVKIARENAILGLYEKALEKYKIALPIIQNRIKEVNEEIIKNKWKNLENCIKKEFSTIYELVQTRDVFKKVYVESEAKKANNVANVDFSYKNNNDDKNSRDADDILKNIDFVKNLANQVENKVNNIQKKKDDDYQKPNNDFNRYANNNVNKKEEKKYTPPQKNNNNNYNNNNYNNYNNNNKYVPPRGGGGGGRINPMVQINNALNNYQPSKKMYDKYGKLANYGPDGYMGGGGGGPSSGYSNNRGGGSKSGNNNDNKNDGNKSAFLLHCYPDGVGPDSELIEMLEREVVDSNPHVQFNDIAELKNAKGALMEAAILPLMKPEFFKGIRRPWKGILLYGPPGTGKTMLAKALATQNRTTFFNVHSSSFASKWRGESEKLVRILFEMAQFYAPTTIFIDEVDSLCSKRGEGGEGNDSRRVKTEILVRMDGLNSDNNTEENEGDKNNNKKGDEPPKNKIVTVVGATNRPWDLDDALRRRFEKRIYIPLPNVDGRRQLFELNLKKVAVDNNVDYDKLIKATDGYSGADIANVCREAALMPLRKALKANKGREIEDLVDDRNFRTEIEKAIGMEDLNAAIENISKSVSKKDLETYDQWTKEFGSV
jgi:katanin p60 ATPase-containing subunit A1